MHIAKDTVVSIEYSLRNRDDELLDATEVGRPIAYLHGYGNIVSGLEEALEGKSEGEQVTVTVPPDKAYGEREESLVQTVPLSAFPEGEPPHPGMRYRAETQSGTTAIIVTAVEGDEVTIDANPVLAGQTLRFSVDVVAVREASDAEIEAGDVHEPGE